MPSQLEIEIGEQGDALRHRLASTDDVGRAAEILGRRDVQQVVIAARGTSDNVARYGQYLLGRDARLLVGLATPSLFAAPDAAPRLDGAAVVGISQSGQSPDIVGVLAAARVQGRPTVALTNQPASPLAQQADTVVRILEGAEHSVAATKTYLASLFAMAQIAEVLAPRPGRSAWMQCLADVIDDLVGEQLASPDPWAECDDPQLVTVLGRGLQYATAHETALKLRELSGVPAEAFSPPDLLHGPIAAVTSATLVWLVAPAGSAPADLIRLVTALRERGSAITAVGADRELLARADFGVRIADVPDWAAPMLAVVPGQVAALRLAERRGVEVDRPFGLAKVTITR